ncbi:MAG TPA: CHAT domain-containing protein, partial [Blastocatellia bacterium]|nr:CHAT domain-containing protein [Blastocatellia bacterium]
QFDTALEYYRQGRRGFQKIGDRRGAAHALYRMAIVETDRGNLEAARVQMEEVLGVVESSRAKIEGEDLRSSYFASAQSYFEFYIHILMQLNRLKPSEQLKRHALEVSEQARARSLVESLTNARADIREGVDRELLNREHSLKQRLDAKTERQVRLLAREHSEAEAHAIARELELLTIEYRDVQTLLRSRSPRYASLTQPAPLTIEQIQEQVLDPGTLLLEYSLGKERSYLWVLSKTSLVSYALPNRAVIDTAARRVYELLTARRQHRDFETGDERGARLANSDAEYRKAAAGLSQMLLGPASQLLGKKRLLVVPDGALHYIPFSALPAPAPQSTARESAKRGMERESVPLIVDHEVVSLPSASTLAVLRRELVGRSPAPKMLAVLADPVFEATDRRVSERNGKPKNDPDGVQIQDEADPTRTILGSLRDSLVNDSATGIPRLPFTRQEAIAITSLAREGEYRLGLDFDATRAAATAADLVDYRFVHFATHGFINSDDPELSGIVFSLVDTNGMERPGILQAYEVYGMRLSADLVVLSGCRTGLGKEVHGEGIVGLTRGFMYAGAARVMVTLWNVNDRATAEMMKRFYQRLLAKEPLSPAAALRAAQVSMWRDKRWNSPYYWAGFVLQGEPR